MRRRGRGERTPLNAEINVVSLIDVMMLLVVSITSDGRIFADDVELTLAEFRSSFKALADNAGKEGVYLRADRRVVYGRAVEVLAIMRAAGVGNIGLVAEPEDVVK